MYRLVERSIRLLPRWIPVSIAASLATSLVTALCTPFPRRPTHHPRAGGETAVTSRPRGVEGRRLPRSSSDHVSSGSGSNDNRSSRRSSSSVSRRINPNRRLLLERGMVTGGASSTVFHQLHIDHRAFFFGDTEPADAGRAAEFLSPHPIPSSATAPASVNALVADAPWESGPYVPGIRGVLPGVMFGFSDEGLGLGLRRGRRRNGVKSACRCPGWLI